MDLKIAPRLFAIALSCLAVNSAWAEDSSCIPARKFIPIDDRNNAGEYARVHPSGNYVLVSGNGGARIFDLTKDPATSTVTPANDETYPVEGSWELLASPNHDDGMRYFSFNDLLRGTGNTPPVFNDAQHNQYYHSAAEFPDSTKDKLHFRTVLWDQLRYRDYTVTRNSQGAASVTKSSITHLCGVISDGKPVEPDPKITVEQTKKMEALEEQRLAIATKIVAVEAVMNHTHDRGMMADYQQKINDMGNEMETTEEEIVQIRRELGLTGADQNVSQPIVSKDGNFVAAIVENKEQTLQTLQIFKVSGKNCERVADTGFATGKPSFAYPGKDGKNHRLAFTSSSIPDETSGAPTRLDREHVTDAQLEAAMAANEEVRSYVQGRGPDLRHDPANEADMRRNIADYLNRGGSQGRSSNSVYVYDTETKTTQKISEASEGPSYPGFTRDGRVIYAGRSGGRTGFFVVDPNQQKGGSGHCITVDQAKAAAVQTAGATR